MTLPLTEIEMLAFALAAFSPFMASGSIAAVDPFVGFSGRWKGAGTVSMTDDPREAIRCRADYTTDAAANPLHLNAIRANDSCRINIVADVWKQNRSFSGSRQEITRQIQGDVTGSMPRSGQMQASLRTVGGGIQLGATTDGKRQAITLRPQGTEVQDAEIVLVRP